MNVGRLLRVISSRIVLSDFLTGIYDRIDLACSGTRSLGQQGEKAAERYVMRKGWIVVERGFTARGGEIDLIAVDSSTIVFVEVKTRSSDRKGHPTEAVTLEKQRHLTRAAYSYLSKKQLGECSFRFDIISIIWPDTDQTPTIEHYPNAFEATGNFQLV